jgi:hypothetical protein
VPLFDDMPSETVKRMVWFANGVEIGDLVQPALMAACTKHGLVSRESHAASGFTVYARTKKAEDTNSWNPATMPNLLVTDYTSKVVGRSFNRPIPLGDSVFPEAWRANWPQDVKPVVTALIDGWQTIKINRRGNAYPFFTGKYGADFKPYQYAARTYFNLAAAKRFGGNIWPDGYSPVFEVTTSDSCKCVPSGDKLYLVALVNLRTGVESDFQTVQAYAKMLGIHTPQLYPSEDAAQHCKPERGYMLRFDIPNAPSLRIKVETDKYLQTRRLLEDWKVSDILANASAQKEDPFFRDSSLPIKFRFWVQRKHKIFNNAFIKHSLEFADVWKAFPYKYDANPRWDKVLEYLVSNGKTEYYSAVVARMTKENFNQRVWKVVENNFLRQNYNPCYLDSVTGGDITL